MKIMVHKRKGFSLFEMLIVIAILVAVTGIITPYVLNMIDKAKAQVIMEVYSNISSAVSQYRNDMLRGTNLPPNSEDLLPIEDGENLDKEFHTLFHPPTDAILAAAWKGPYIARPLTTKDNPMGKGLKLERNLDSSGRSWKIIDASSPPLGGPGAYIRFEGIPEDISKRVDSLVDAVDTANWKTLGKVQLGGATGTTLFLFILDLNGKDD